MKKKLTLDIPESLFSVKEEVKENKKVDNPKFPNKPSEKELPERIDHKEEMLKRKMVNLVRAIAKRTSIELPKEDTIKKEGKDKKQNFSLELNLTQKQIDSLPIGLKKLLK